MIGELNLGALDRGWTKLWPMTHVGAWPPKYVWPAEQSPAMPQLTEKLIGVRSGPPGLLGT
jgi:hypothetical protein